MKPVELNPAVLDNPLTLTTNVGRQFEMFTKGNALRGGETKSTLDEYRKAFNQYWDLMATAKDKVVPIAVEKDLSVDEERHRFLLRDWVVKGSKADDFRKAKSVRDHHDFFNQMEKLSDKTKQQCCTLLMDWVTKVEEKQTAIKLLNVTNTAFDEMFDKCFVPSEWLQKNVMTADEKKFTTPEKRKAHERQVSREIRDSVTEMMAKLTLMGAAGPGHLTELWDAKDKSPMDMTSAELATKIDEKFIDEDTAIKFPIYSSGLSGIVYAGHAERMKEQMQSTPGRMTMKHPFEREPPPKIANQSKINPMFTQEKKKPVSNVLLSGKHGKIDRNSREGKEKRYEKNVESKKSRLEDGQFWEERRCEKCVEAGAPSSVYKTHNSDTCRGWKRAKTDDTSSRNNNSNNNNNNNNNRKNY
jgi:hypothetical protein